MGNVQGEIDRISGAKTTLGDYLTQNGVSVASGDKIDTMASKLSNVTAKQDKITAKGILKGDGAGTITAAVAGTDYAAASHTHSLAGIMGSAAKGSATKPIYWSGSAFTPITSYEGKAATAGTADKVANSININGKTYDGSAAVNVGVIGAAYGGSGKTTLTDSANAFINALTSGTATPSDGDYYISQWANAASSTDVQKATYVRRPISSLWTYIKSKIPSWALAASKPTYTATEVGAEASGAVSTHNTSASAHSTLFANKVDKVSGKGLSTNDYTTAEKTKLSGIETGAQKNVQADWAATSGAAAILNKPTLPTVAQAQVTLTAAGWSGTTQTVTVSGVTADNMVIVTYAPGSRAAWTDADIYCSAQAANTLVFTCDTAPTTDVIANVAIFG